MGSLTARLLENSNYFSQQTKIQQQEHGHGLAEMMLSQKICSPHFVKKDIP